MDDGEATSLDGFSRYAAYHAPDPDSPLARLGRAWLDGGHGAPPDAALPRPRAQLTAQARRYGLHATLKAPFRLAQGETAGALDAALAALAARLPPAPLGALSVSVEHGFVVLRPARDDAASALAAACVTDLDRFRAPLDPQDRARRGAEALDPEGAALFERWGYPHVLERFRFHLTLTCALPPDEAERSRAVLAEWMGPALAGPHAVEALWLYGDPGGGEAFRPLRRHALGRAGGASPDATRS